MCIVDMAHRPSGEPVQTRWVPVQLLRPVVVLVGRKQDDLLLLGPVAQIACRNDQATETHASIMVLG